MKGPDADFLRGVTYLASFPDLKAADARAPGPLVAFVGRSNSGKSTLVSAICDHAGLAQASRRAGKTRLLNYFRVPAHSDLPEFHMVDLPGYGYAAASAGERKRMRALVDSFLLHAEQLVLLVLVLDARREAEAEELGVLAHCREIGRRVVFARTKWDRLNAREKRTARTSWRREGFSDLCVPVASPKRQGLAEILIAVRGALRQGSGG